MKIGSSVKDELYLCGRGIVNEFFALAGSTPSPITPNVGCPLPTEVLLSNEKTKQLKIEFKMMKFRVAHSL